MSTHPSVRPVTPPPIPLPLALLPSNLILPQTSLPTSASPPSTPPAGTPSPLAVATSTGAASLVLSAARIRAISPPTPAPSPQPSSFSTFGTGRFPTSNESEWSPAGDLSSDHEAFDQPSPQEDEYSEENMIEGIRIQYSSMSLMARQKLLTRLIADSTPSTLSPLLPLITPRLKRDFLKTLPVELAFHVLAFVADVKTLQRASGVSRYWRALFQDEATWKRLCWVSGFGAGEINQGRKIRSLEFGEREQEEGTPAGRERRGTLDRNSLQEFAARAEFFGVRIDEMEGVQTLATSPTIVTSGSSLILDTTAAEASGVAFRRLDLPATIVPKSDSRRGSGSSRRSKNRSNGTTTPSDIPKLRLAPTPEIEAKPFSYKSHFKRAYLTESNWIKGPGRLLSTQMSTDDGVVTSLGFDSEWIVVGMATSKVHVFEAENGTYVRTLEGHELGVWCLTLVSKGGGIREEVKNDEKGKSRSTSVEEWPTFDLPSASLRAPPLSARHSEDTSSASSSNPHSTQGASGLFHSETTFDSSSAFFHPPPLSSSAPRSPSSASNASPNSNARGPRRRQSFHSFSSEVPSHSADGVRMGGMGLGAGGETGDSPQQAGACGTARGYGRKGALVVSAGCDRDVRVWDVESGECLHILRGHSSTVRCMRVIDGRPIAVSGSRDATLRVWNIETGEAMHTLVGHDNSVRCIETSGNKVVSGSYDTTCRLWDVDTGECLFVYRGHDHQIYSVAFSGDRVVTGSLDSTVRIWSATTGEFLALLQGHTSLVGQLQLDPVSNVLVTGGSDGRVIVFNIATFETYHRLCAHDNSVTCLQFDDRFIVTGGNDGSIMLWDFKTGAFIRELAERCDAVWKVTFRDDKCVILCRRDGKTLMDVRTFRPGPDEI